MATVSLLLGFSVLVQRPVHVALTGINDNPEGCIDIGSDECFKRVLYHISTLWRAECASKERLNVPVLRESTMVLMIAMTNAHRNGMKGV